ncbi:MAG: phosphatidylserine decarboxylase, partial [Lachnospiraceae bacterium]|nr:phosphatidylserine decarboxylase [Lachnospiraceae bacterium]
MKYADRNGNFFEDENPQDRFTENLYGKRSRSPLKTLMITKPVSDVTGAFNNSVFSKLLIRPFIRKNGIDMSSYEDRDFKSFNDFFCRQIKEGERPFDTEPLHLPSPCDGKVTAYEIGAGKRFKIKGIEYTLDQLLKSKKAASVFAGGTVVIIRLSVDDLHRYSYVDSGIKSRNIVIPGKYHTVNPHAAEHQQIYAENSREYTLIKTDHFGP